MGREPPLADGQVHRSRRFAAVAGLGQCEWSTRFIAGAPLAALAVESPAGRKSVDNARSTVSSRGPALVYSLERRWPVLQARKLFFLTTSCVT